VNGLAISGRGPSGKMSRIGGKTHKTREVWKKAQQRAFGDRRMRSSSVFGKKKCPQRRCQIRGEKRCRNLDPSWGSLSQNKGRRGGEEVNLPENRKKRHQRSGIRGEVRNTKRHLEPSAGEKKKQREAKYNGLRGIRRRTENTGQITKVQSQWRAGTKIPS